MGRSEPLDRSVDGGDGFKKDLEGCLGFYSNLPFSH